MARTLMIERKNFPSSRMVNSSQVVLTNQGSACHLLPSLSASSSKVSQQFSGPTGDVFHHYDSNSKKTSTPKKAYVREICML